MIDDWKPMYNWRYLITHPYELIFQYGRNIKWFLQRGWRGYADCDVWSIDDYLSTWMPKALRKLNKYGHPCGLTQKKWDDIVEQIARGFEAHRKNSEYPDKDTYDKLYEKEKTGLTLFVKYFGDLWD
jgi:hypothetical protein